MRAKVTYNFRLNLFASEASIVCSGILTCCTIHVFYSGGRSVCEGLSVSAGRCVRDPSRPFTAEPSPAANMEGSVEVTCSTRHVISNHLF